MRRGVRPPPPLPPRVHAFTGGPACACVHRCAAACTTLASLVRSHGDSLWRSALGQRLRLEGERGARREWRLLYGVLVGRIEAKGWADDSELDNADEMRHAWWQAEALAFDAASGVVRVRYHGYEDEAEDEWRPLAQLRRYCAKQPASWREAKRSKGEPVEVSWAPPDHPAARWEATVLQVRQHKAKVRFVGFDTSWDTWMPHASDDLFPGRPHDTIALAMEQR